MSARLAAILLAVTLLAVPAAAGLERAPVALADEGDDDKTHGEGDENRGHGNESDGHDEDNPGRGGENGPEKKDKEDSASEGPPGPVETLDAYTVDIECEYDAEAGDTTCVFTGVAPDSGSDVSHIDIPEEAVCAEVIDGEYEYVDPDPNTRVTGYKSRGSEGSLTLVLDGEVVTSGTATYWIKSGDGVFPAEGPGLECDLAAGVTTEAGTDETGKSAAEATFASTTTADAESGSLSIRAYACNGMPEDRSAFDWFGACEPAGTGIGFRITPASDAAAEPTEVDTGEDGSVTIDGLASRAYTVELTGGSWCHAKSDNVNADSEVLVQAGATSTVWIFVCDTPAAGA